MGTCVCICARAQYLYQWQFSISISTTAWWRVCGKTPNNLIATFDWVECRCCLAKSSPMRLTRSITSGMTEMNNKATTITTTTTTKTCSSSYGFCCCCCFPYPVACSIYFFHDRVKVRFIIVNMWVRRFVQGLRLEANNVFRRTRLNRSCEMNKKQVSNDNEIYRKAGTFVLRILETADDRARGSHWIDISKNYGSHDPTQNTRDKRHLNSPYRLFGCRTAMSGRCQRR